MDIIKRAEQITKIEKNLPVSMIEIKDTPTSRKMKQAESASFPEDMIRIESKIKDSESIQSLKATYTKTFKALKNKSASEARGASEKLETEQKVREWNFIVFKIEGHGLAEDYKYGMERLKKLGTTKNSYITVAIEQDGKIMEYAVKDEKQGSKDHLEVAKQGVKAKDPGEKSMLSRKFMTDFLLNTIHQYPAKHYMINFEGHSRQIRKAVPEIHYALKAAKEELGKKIDVIVFDSCFLGQIETASEFKDVADYMASSEEGVMKSRPIEEFARKGGNLSPKELAKLIVDTAKEYTFSAIDLSKVDEFNKRMKNLGERIRDIKDPKSLKEIRNVIKDSQHYYTEGLTGPNTFRNLVDIYDFISRLIENPEISGNYPNLVAAGKNVLEYLEKKPDGMIFAEKHSEKVDRYYLDYIFPKDSHGLSMHLPLTPKVFRDRYTYFKNSQFNRETYWDKVNDHITSTRTPLYLAYSLCHYIGGLAIAALNYTAETVAEIFRGMKKISWCHYLVANHRVS